MDAAWVPHLIRLHPGAIGSNQPAQLWYPKLRAMLRHQADCIEPAAPFAAIACDIQRRQAAGDFAEQDDCGAQGTVASSCGSCCSGSGGAMDFISSSTR